jgi:hypothetical protein
MVRTTCPDASFASPCEVEHCEAKVCAVCQRKLAPDHLVAWHGHFGRSVCDQECAELYFSRLHCGMSEEEVYELAYRMMLEALAPHSLSDASQWTDAEVEAESAQYQQETCAPLSIAWDLAHQEDDDRDDAALEAWSRQQLGDKRYEAYAAHCIEVSDEEDAFEQARGDFGE